MKIVELLPQVILHLHKSANLMHKQKDKAANEYEHGNKNTIHNYPP